MQLFVLKTACVKSFGFAQKRQLQPTYTMDIVATFGGLRRNLNGYFL